jgi:uncharacterized protein (TIGR00730 family)
MRLVYGAGGSGLMGILAHSVLDNGGKIYGVTERIVRTFEQPIKKIIHRTAPNIQKRKREFLDHSNAFIILPGGWGTYDEFFDVIIGKEIVDRHNRYAKPVKYREQRPIVVVDTDGYYGPLVKMIRHSIDAGFMIRDDLKLFKVVKTPKEAFEFIKASRKK